MKKDNRLKIAIQKSGRLNQPSMAFLVSLGLEFLPNGSSLVQECGNFDLDVLFLRDDDIPEFVSRGVADFGIVGQNVLLEERADIELIRNLDFGKCRLAIAAPENSPIKNPQDLEGERIATTYPYLLRRYLKSQKIGAAVIPITGSVEIAPELNLADAICDIVQTGTTLKAHRLIPIATIIESQAVFISSPFQKESKNQFLKKFEFIQI
jgi:ATP phosphoribosyltransferase